MGRWLALVVLLGVGFAQGLGFRLSLGLTWNTPADLQVRQAGETDTTVRAARWVGKDLEWFPYYTVRLWYGEPAGLRYELELIHQKLYFAGADENGEILDYFEITDGFNYVLFNLAYGLNLGSSGAVQLVPRVGVGVVIPHPYTSVRGKPFGVDGDPGGYQFGGFGGQIALGLESPVSLTPALEGKFTLAHSRFTIADGEAEGWFSSLHGTFGLGYWRP